jgi:hypothetical protein
MAQINKIKTPDPFILSTNYPAALKYLNELKQKNPTSHPLLFAVQTKAPSNATVIDKGSGEIDPTTIPIAPPKRDPNNPGARVPATFNYACLLGKNDCYYWEYMNNGNRPNAPPQKVYHNCKLKTFGTTYYCVYPGSSDKNGCGGSPWPDIPKNQLPK